MFPLVFLEKPKMRCQFDSPVCFETGRYIYKRLLWTVDEDLLRAELHPTKPFVEGAAGVDISPLGIDERFDHF